MKKTELAGHIIDGNFPGGNIVIDRVDADVVYLHQDLRDTEVFWFYWCFRVRGAETKTLTFVFTQGDVIGTRGPAVSLDAGKTWGWLGSEAVCSHKEGVSFSYTFSDVCDEVRFCFTGPYLESHLNTFIKTHTDSVNMRVETLCHTRKGRLVEVLHLGCLDGSENHRVLLTSRHHACESMATYVLEGLMTIILGETEAGVWLQNHVAFFIVPFMDKDGVEDGDQGKLRKPRDHNRDYQGESIYATTRSLRQVIPVWSENKLHVALDLHCPYIKGEGNEDIFFVGGPRQANWSRVTEFSRLLENVQTGKLVYRTSDNLAFGKKWNTNQPAGISISRWAAGLPGIEIATSIEIPYANVRTETVTANTARDFGRDLAQALYHWLMYNGKRL